ncbi:hypothetical protein [Agrococcus sp. Ld7]|uniref:hypothetical protein n=1 Tax=Agrococcus sp. Ld7 TaxID=649148 RepID=UPI00386C5BAA
MTGDELERVSGIRDVSSLYRNFDGEDVVIRPASGDRKAFRIEVMLEGDKAVFPATAPVEEGDLLERNDPRGGVIEYAIARYDFVKAPMSHFEDQWDATLVRKGRVARSFAQPQIVVHGGTNQFSIGDHNKMKQFNGAGSRELLEALDEAERSIPCDDLSSDQVEAVQDAIADVRSVASSDAKPSTMKRAIYGMSGVVDEVADSSKAGAKDGVKSWAAATTAAILSHVVGLSQY